MPALVHAATIEQSSHTWSSKFLSAASLLPAPDRMGEALRLTIGLDPGPMMARPLPVCRCEGSLSPSPTPTKRPPLAPTPWSRLRGAHLAGRVRKKKAPLRDAHCGWKSVSRAQPPRRPSFYVKHKRAARSAPRRVRPCKRQTCNLVGERGVGVCSGQSTVRSDSVRTYDDFGVVPGADIRATMLC